MSRPSAVLADASRASPAVGDVVAGAVGDDGLAVALEGRLRVGGDEVVEEGLVDRVAGGDPVVDAQRHHADVLAEVGALLVVEQVADREGPDHARASSSRTSARRTKQAVRRLRIAGCFEPEADTPHRDHALGDAGLLELLTQPPDGHVQRLGGAVPVLVPHLGHQLVAGDDLVAVLGEQRQHVELLAGQQHLVVVGRRPDGLPRRSAVRPVGGAPSSARAGALRRSSARTRACSSARPNGLAR